MMIEIVKINLKDSKYFLHNLDWNDHNNNNRSGAQINTLYENEDKSIALVRFNPGAEAKPHIHNGFESIFVIEGSYQDEFGRHIEGDLIIYPNNSVHSWSSQEGALLYVVWGGTVESID
ncbi:cupin domain-containing protein [Marinomonas primoryensis]|uniref:Cupin domain-containing protein n=1 Tax=Marinomonas primoryensis TaxID=178399 RepID=A0ABV0KX03_9GAMM